MQVNIPKLLLSFVSSPYSAAILALPMPTEAQEKKSDIYIFYEILWGLDSQ